MPLNVLEYVKVDQQLPVKQIAAFLVKSALKTARAVPASTTKERELTCRECNGVVVQLFEGK